MTKKEILEFIKANPMCSLATVEGTQPRVRIIMLYRADEKGIIFITTSMKALYKQLQANPAVEMCFYNPKEFRQVRIEGKAEILNDMELKKQVVEKLSFLKPLIDSKGYDVLICFRLKKAKAHLWTMETNFTPKEYIEL
jgi:pyridoxamine 5'-phosphate oxidase